MGKSGNNKQKKEKIWPAIAIGVVGSLLASLIIGLITFAVKLPGQIEHISNTLDSIDQHLAKVDEMGLKIDAIYDKEIIAVNEGVYSNSLTKIDFILEPLMVDNMVQYTISTEKETGELSSNVVDDDSEYIFVDSVTKNRLTYDDIKGKSVLYPYTDNNGDIVFFYGSYDENFNWDGRCVINIFHDSELIFINDAVYEHGNTHEYRQFARGTKRYENSWWIQDRFHYAKYNDGETWRYTKPKEDIMLTKALEDITLDDIFTVQRVVEGNDLHLESYYNGQTLNGEWFDDTGEAFLITYDADGNILTFYQGGFAESNFNDSRGIAWEISRSDKEGSTYIFYEGRFDDNERLDFQQKGDKDKWNPRDIKSMNELTTILKEHGFQVNDNIPMNWKEDAFLIKDVTL